MQDTKISRQYWKLRGKGKCVQKFKEKRHIRKVTLKLQSIYMYRLQMICSKL